MRQAIQSVLETKEDRDGGTCMEVARLLYFTFPAKAHRSYGILKIDSLTRKVEQPIERLQLT